MYTHSAAARWAVQGPLIAWLLLEYGLRWRNRAFRRGFEWTFAAVLVGVYSGIALGFVAATNHWAPTGGGWPVVIAGAAIMVAGIALRIWAIAVLGNLFDYAVTIHPDHHLVEAGPYRVLRHPSYTGLLLALGGLGIALADWVSLAALVVLPLAGVLMRIRAEEAALTGAFGERYASYAARTARLVPGVW
jgi:protein-S-isoprenylcysteine O-methyltransferase Ste14